ncbi:hypothetical protein [Klebsiella pneumoniae]|uniref:hypothetical protein n=1 Tax=Klebsiella pneumoniae TaxID=573 RepID=UPI001D0D90D9|nr:hypothetical protein [Klebsiella pneumoniae]
MRKEMAQAGLKPSLMVDCSHGNSIKISAASRPWLNPSRRSKDGNRSIIGLMIESNIHEGNQSSEQPREAMKYGVSVTDACISWETTERCCVNWIRISAATGGPFGLRGKYGC